MASQTFGWVPPANQNNIDVGLQLTLGVLFSSTVAGPCTGGRIWVPTTRPTGPAPGRVQLWTAAGVILAGKTFDWSTIGTPGAYTDLTFDGVDPTLIADGGPPVALVPSDPYMISVQTFERWGGTPSYGWPVTVGVLTALTNNGWLKLGYGFPDLESGADQNYSVSPIVTVADAGAAPKPVVVSQAMVRSTSW